MALSGESDVEHSCFLVVTTLAYPQNDAILSFMLTYLQRHKDFARRTVGLQNIQYEFRR